MLKHLGFENVGPAPKMEVEFSPCLNIITGDNGLGKTFLLDVAWWAFTRTWAREKIVPHQPPAEGKITSRFDDIQDIRDFDRADGRWINFHRKRFVSNKPVIYAQVDGGFSVWESERNRKVAEPVVYHFGPKEVWDGNGRCEGLIRDWALWQSSKDTTYFDQLQSVLRVLSPSPGDLIEVGELRTIAIDDPKRYPTLKLPYGQEVAQGYAE